MARSIQALMLAAVLATPTAAFAGRVARRPADSEKAWARSTARVSGRVVEADGTARAGITVIATHARGGAAHGRAVSSADGRFHLALPPGEYVFMALDREVSGASPVLAVTRALEMVLVVSGAITSA